MWTMNCSNQQKPNLIFHRCRVVQTMKVNFWFVPIVKCNLHTAKCNQYPTIKGWSKLVEHLHNWDVKLTIFWQDFFELLIIWIKSHQTLIVYDFLQGCIAEPASIIENIGSDEWNASVPLSQTDVSNFYSSVQGKWLWLINWSSRCRECHKHSLSRLDLLGVVMTARATTLLKTMQ